MKAGRLCFPIIMAATDFDFALQIEFKSDFNQTVPQNLRHRAEAPVEQSANLLGFLQPLWLLRPGPLMFHFQPDMLWTTQFLKKQKINKINQ